MPDRVSQRNVGFLIIFIACFFCFDITTFYHPKTPLVTEISRDYLGQSLLHGFQIHKGLPSSVHLITQQDQKTSFEVEYTWDPVLQKYLENLLQTIGPNYGAVVVLDAKNGEVLSLLHHNPLGEIENHLALSAIFPAASIFKIVTAIGALELEGMDPQALLPHRGRNYTLFRHQLVKNAEKDRHITLQEAFGKSINSVFGKIGAFHLGSESLRQLALRMGFNRSIPFCLPLEPSFTSIPLDAWGVAEVASGFTQRTKISPLHGALLGAAMLQEGKMQNPHMIKNLHHPKYHVSIPKNYFKTQAFSPQTALYMGHLMQDTIEHGTAKKAFKHFLKKWKPLGVRVGGKTGTLTSLSPYGKTDWFIGTLQWEEKKIAISVLMVHHEMLKLKSAQIAKNAFEQILLASF